MLCWLYFLTNFIMMSLIEYSIIIKIQKHEHQRVCQAHGINSYSSFLLCSWNFACFCNVKVMSRCETHSVWYYYIYVSWLWHWLDKTFFYLIYTIRFEFIATSKKYQDCLAYFIWWSCFIISYLFFHSRNWIFT